MARLVLFLVSLGLAGPLLAQDLSTVEGTVRGEIVDHASGRGIPAAQVEYLDAGDRVRATVTTDGEGAFLLPRVPAGVFRLRATRIGYATTISEPGRVDGGEILTVLLRLRPEAIPLAPLEITARARALSPVLEGFYNRRDRAGGGEFFTRDDIEREGARRITDLLRSVPGIRITMGPGFGSGRLVSMVPPGPGRSDGSCPIQVFVNGVPAGTRTLMAGGGGLAGVDGVPVDHLAAPEELEGIEVYRGIGSVPPEFLTPDAGCGVIALWRRIER